MRSFKSNENIHKKEGGSYYIVSHVGVYRNYGLLSIRKKGWKERKKEERKNLFYTNDILIITLMQ